MKLTDQVTLYPNASVSGRNGTVVDTGIDVHWPGPGRVYLHPREVAEAVRVAHVLPEVADVLDVVGWIPKSVHDDVVNGADALITDLRAHVAEIEGQLAAALKTIQLVPAEQPAPEPKAAEAKPAAKKPAKKKDTTDG